MYSTWRREITLSSRTATMTISMRLLAEWFKYNRKRHHQDGNTAPARISAMQRWSYPKMNKTQLGSWGVRQHDNNCQQWKFTDDELALIRNTIEYLTKKYRYPLDASKIIRESFVEEGKWEIFYKKWERSVVSWYKSKDQDCIEDYNNCM